MKIITDSSFSSHCMNDRQHLKTKFVTQLSEVSRSKAPPTPVAPCMPVMDMTRNCASVGGVAVFAPPPVLVVSVFHFATAFLAD